MIKFIVVSLLSLAVSGCTTIGYYAQIINGHMQLMAKARPIPEVVNDAETDPALRQQLERASDIREFASRELALPDNLSYHAYADLNRPFVVWNVFAASEFSVELQPWCIVFVGCVKYRGYYDQGDAVEFASKLRAQGFDTYVGGVPAYTTLGYFNDPVLNTFLRFGDNEVARIIFHELAHQVVYIRGDTAFNESFATAVEDEGVHRWLTRTATPERMHAIEAQRMRKAQFTQLITDTREKLHALYTTSQSPDEKRRAKKALITEMKHAYADMKTSWGGFSGYDSWFGQPVNNATLGSVSLYTKWVPAFHTLLEQEHGNLPSFYLRVAALADMPKTERTAELEHLMPRNDTLICRARRD